MPYTNNTQATLSTLDAILKTQYLPAVNEQLNNATVLFSRLQRDYDSVVGKNFTLALHTGRNNGTGARAENADLPTPGAQSYVNSIIPMKYYYGSIQLTGQTIKAAKVSEGAYLQALDSEMKGLFRDIKVNLNKQMWGDGSGFITKCGTTSNATTVVVDSTADLKPGMRIDITVISSGATSTGILNVYVDSIVNATSFKISGSTGVTTDNTFAVYRQGSRTSNGTTATDMEMMGFNGIFSDTLKLQNLDPATETYWKANVLGNSGTPRDISETLMQTAMDTTEINSDCEVSAVYTTYGIRRAYQALLQTKKQYVNPLQLKGGWTALDYNGKPLIVDKDCPANKIFFACEDEIKIYRLADLEWMQEDGAVLCRVPNKDAYYSQAFMYSELATTKRNGQTLVTDVKEG